MNRIDYIPGRRYGVRSACLTVGPLHVPLQKEIGSCDTMHQQRSANWIRLGWALIWWFLSWEWTIGIQKDAYSPHYNYPIARTLKRFRDPPERCLG